MSQSEPAPETSPARPAVLCRRFDPLLRLIERETELSRLSILRLELALARSPRIQKLVRSLPRNLKALAPNFVPFPAWLWRRPGDPPAQLRPDRLDGAPGRRRLDAAFEYLHQHPRATLAQAARYARLSVRKLRHSPRFLEFCLARGLPLPRRFTKGLQLQRALACLRGQRPTSMREVALATGVSPALLSLNRAFRAAWARYENSPRSRQNASSKVHRALEARRVRASPRPSPSTHDSELETRSSPSSPLTRNSKLMTRNSPWRRFDPSVYATRRWRRLSRYVRFVRADARCEHCGVHHGVIAPDFRSVILLTCAHLNGDSRDLRLENLRALCPKCHFEYDCLRRVLQRLGVPQESIAALARDPRRPAALAGRPRRSGSVSAEPESEGH